MTTVTQAELACDVCGDTNDVKTRTFGLDGTAYEIDLCRKDGNALGKVAARYIAKARKVTAKRRRRRHNRRPGSRTASAASGDGTGARAAGSKQATKASRSRRQKGIYVYGILPADIEVAGDIPGVGVHGQDPDAARDARTELGQFLSQAVKARRPEDTRTLMQAMERLCVASVAREPAYELDAVHVAFLVAVDHGPEVERVIEDLAHEWEGRIDVQLLGPMAAYDFAGTAQPES